MGHNSKMDLKEAGLGMSSEFIWLKIEAMHSSENTVLQPRKSYAPRPSVRKSHVQETHVYARVKCSAVQCSSRVYSAVGPSHLTVSRSCLNAVLWEMFCSLRITEHISGGRGPTETAYMDRSAVA